MFALIVYSPLASMVSSATYGALAFGVILAIAIYWPQVRERHALDPRITRVVLAFLLALGIATTGTLADTVLYMCSPDWITAQCGYGDSWCRSYFEWSCWLQGAG